MLLERRDRHLRHELFDDVNVREAAIVGSHFGRQLGIPQDGSPSRVDELFHAGFVVGRCWPKKVFWGHLRNEWSQKRLKRLAHYGVSSFTALGETHELPPCSIKTHRPIYNNQVFFEPELLSGDGHDLPKAKPCKKIKTEHRPSTHIQVGLLQRFSHFFRCEGYRLTGSRPLEW